MMNDRLSLLLSFSLSLFLSLKDVVIDDGNNSDATFERTR